MRKTLVLSGVALSALVLGMAPAGAVSITIGGGGGLVSVDSGSSGSTGAAGDSSGGNTTEGSDGLLNLGKGPLLDLSGDADVDAAVDIDLGLGGDGSGVTGNDGIVDLDTGGENGVIVDLFGKDGAIADVELGLTGKEDDLLDLGGENGLVNLDTGGNDGVILDLFGEGGAIADAQLGLGDDALGMDNDLLDVNGDGDAAVNVNLLGRSAPAGASESFATIDLGNDAGGLRSAPATIDLFGPGNGDIDDTATGSVTPSTGGASGGGAPTDVADNDDGSDEGAGTAAPGAVTPAPGAGSVTPVRPQPIRPSAGRVASVATTGSTTCFSPDKGQIAHLLARNSYSAEVRAELQAAEKIQLVPINLCADARAQLDAALAADPNIEALQTTIAADAEISAALEPAYQPDDVLAADPSGEDLTVYVY